MPGRPCCVCGRPAIRVNTFPSVVQHLCQRCLDARSETMPKGFPKPLDPADPIPTRRPKPKRNKPTGASERPDAPPTEDPKP